MRTLCATCATEATDWLDAADKSAGDRDSALRIAGQMIRFIGEACVKEHQP